MASSTVTPERELSKAVRETLKMVRQGKTATEIAKKRKVTSSAVYSAFRRLEEAGYGDVLGNRARNGSAGNGGASAPTAPTAPPRAVEVAAGIEHAVTAVVSNRDALQKTVENLEAEAVSLEGQAQAKAEEAREHRAEIAVLDSMLEVSNGGKS